MTADTPRLDRRTVLRGAGAVVAVGVLAGCNRDRDGGGGAYRMADPSGPPT